MPVYMFGQMAGSSCARAFSNLKGNALGGGKSELLFVTSITSITVILKNAS